MNRYRTSPCGRHVYDDSAFCLGPNPALVSLREIVEVTGAPLELVLHEAREGGRFGSARHNLGHVFMDLPTAFEFMAGWCSFRAARFLLPVISIHEEPSWSTHPLGCCGGDAELHKTRVNHATTAIETGKKLSPVPVDQDHRSGVWLARDGKHRLAAARLLGLVSISCSDQARGDNLPTFMLPVSELSNITHSGILKNPDRELSTTLHAHRHARAIEGFQSGTDLPPIHIYRDRDRSWRLSNGRHRLVAARELGVREIKCVDLATQPLDELRARAIARGRPTESGWPAGHAPKRMR